MSEKKVKTKYVYFFGAGSADGDGSMKQLLGGKGANLAEMSSIGIPVPPGFTISTEVCDYYYKHDRTYPGSMDDQIEENMKKLEEAMGQKFGDEKDPLLVSVRSGAAVSMPGMMDTVLNLGTNDKTVTSLAEKSGNERFAWDSYRRLIQMYGNVVLGIDGEAFEEAIEEMKEERGIENDVDLTAEDLKQLTDQFKKIVRDKTGEDFPQDPSDQLKGAINAVFGSWNNPRARKYRNLNKIRGLLGTAVNVQAMVFGNLGKGSGTGVCFTRNPSTGENKFYGEYLMDAQGEDVVAGIRTPEPVSDLKDEMPEIYDELYEIRNKLEQHYKDMQDVEFTIQQEKLYILQTRTGKRTAVAAIRIATEMVTEGQIDKKTAVRRLEPEALDQLLHPMFDPKAEKDVVAKGLPASPGAATGEVIFTADEAEAEAAKGNSVILVRIETSPEDIGGMHAASGILTSRGGMTSHAAVVARGMGKCCVAGCGDVKIDYANKQFTVDGRTVKQGEFISIDGSSGELMVGKVDTIEPQISGEFEQIMEWADEVRKVRVRTNADTPHDAETAIKFGAEGIGLCRTEHMFFEGERIISVREMILADDLEGREKALAKLLPMQREDFEGIFKAMDGKPVTVRLLDPPLHEFLPHEEKGQKEAADELGVSVEDVRAKMDSLKEFNPMLGFRGCRLAIIYPEICRMQVRAIIEAACNVKKSGVDVQPEIMIPLVGEVNEYTDLKKVVHNVASEVLEEKGEQDLQYMVGTMIEIPRACLIADDIAEEAEFFSFGTNDLTQMTFGFSRDDVGSFVPKYIEKGILLDDPFQVLDQQGVGKLVEMGIEKGRAARKDLKVGICGEHGGEPSSVKFCVKSGMDYVSCSPFRVPIARLSAAQAALEDEE